MTGVRKAAGNGGAAEAPHAGMPAITEREFLLFQSLIHREGGIWLSPEKKTLLVFRLARRLREHGLPSFKAYHELVTGAGAEAAAEKQRMFDCVCTNETHFFREPAHWTYLEEQVFPVWRDAAEKGARPKRIRIWSAACSTGEEPYTLAMVLLARFPAEDGWEVEVLATDLSSRAVEKAQQALWPLAKSAEIPERYLKRFMLRGYGESDGMMKAGPEIRAVVRFARQNLNDKEYAVPRDFDAVFCRNVLIYFDAPSKVRVVEALMRHLAPDGLLLVGHSESLQASTTAVRAVIPTVYTHRMPGERREDRAT